MSYVEPEEPRHEEPERREREREPRRLPREPQREEMRGGPMEVYWTPAGPIRGHPPTEEVDQLVLNARATVADAVPLGLASFAAATFTVGAVDAGWVGSLIVGLLATAPILFIFGGISQYVAAMWAFRKGNTFAATVFGSFGAFNTLFAILIFLIAAGTLPLGTTPVDFTIGIILAMFALIAGYLAYAAVGEAVTLIGVLGFLAAGYALTAAGFFIGLPNAAITAGGYSLIVSSLLAFYVSAVVVINSTLRRREAPY